MSPARPRAHCSVHCWGPSGDEGRRMTEGWLENGCLHFCGIPSQSVSSAAISQNIIFLPHVEGQGHFSILLSEPEKHRTKRTLRGPSILPPALQGTTFCSLKNSHSKSLGLYGRSLCRLHPPAFSCSQSLSSVEKPK